MPELPEVDTIRKELRPLLPFKITGISTSKHYPITFYGTVKKLSRHGKYLCFESDDRVLISNLGMSGRWLHTTVPVEEKHKHIELVCHPCFTINREVYLSYVDPRRFGRIKVVMLSDFKKFFARFGPDIHWNPDFTATWIWSTAALHPKWHLKKLLLDQRYFFGMGNYMASESCARAGINPLVKCKDFSMVSAQRLFDAIREVIKISLDLKGNSFRRGYIRPSNEEGKAFRSMAVYGQKYCGICNGKVRETRRGQDRRVTYYCEKHQSGKVAPKGAQNDRRKLGTGIGTRKRTGSGGTKSRRDAGSARGKTS